jgi:hypothetical protein
LQIVRTLRPVHGAFDPPQFLPGLDYGRAELVENGRGMRHSRNSAGADIQTDNAALRLPKQRRQAFDPASPLSGWRAGPAGAAAAPD